MHVPPIDLAAFRTLVTISAPRVSRNGREIAFVKSVDDFSNDERMSTLEVVATSGGSPRALTRASADLSDPQWSPSGTMLAYIDRGAGKKDQIFVVSVANERTIVACRCVSSGSRARHIRRANPSKSTATTR